MNIFIVSNNKFDGNELVKLLNVFQTINLIAIGSNLQEFTIELEKHQIQLLILFNFNESITLEIHQFALVNKIQVVIISDDYTYALNHSKFKIDGYIVQPYLKNIIFNSIFKFTQNSIIKQPDAQLHANDSSIKYIAVPNHEQIDLIDIELITHLESNNNYTTIYTNDKKSLLTSKNIKDFENRLPKHLFFRVHNSHIVNLKCIKSYLRAKSGSLILTDGSIIPISASKKKELVLRILV
jgi:two-component system, LytTR family, response regulator